MKSNDAGGDLTDGLGAPRLALAMMGPGESITCGRLMYSIALLTLAQ